MGNRARERTSKNRLTGTFSANHSHWGVAIIIVLLMFCCVFDCFAYHENNAVDWLRQTFHFTAPHCAYVRDYIADIAACVVCVYFSFGIISGEIQLMFSLVHLVGFALSSQCKSVVGWAHLFGSLASAILQITLCRQWNFRAFVILARSASRLICTHQICICMQWETRRKLAQLKNK